MSAPDRSQSPSGPDDVEVIERTTVYDGYARVRKLRLRHRLHEGGWGATITRELVERGHAVAVLPYDPVKDAVVLIRQFRVGAYGAGGDPWLVETVAGVVDPGETPQDVARRESVEEAGCTIGELIHVCTYFASPGVLTETIALFIGICDAPDAGGIHGLDHEGEDIQTIVLGWADAARALKADEFRDAKVVMALQWLALNRDTLRRRLRTIRQ